MGTSQVIIKHCCTAAICSTLLLASCRRSAHKSATAPEPVPPSQPHLSPSPNLNPVGEPEPSVTVDNNEKERRQLDSLEQRYLQSADPEEKIETIAQISDLPDAEAVAALGRLFRNEQSVELRCELLGAIIGCEENEPAKLEALTGALLPAQPPSVRQIAIAGLETMDTPEAKELLQRMRYDSDPDIRAAVAEALETEP